LLPSSPTLLPLPPGLAPAGRPARAQYRAEASPLPQPPPSSALSHGALLWGTPEPSGTCEQRPAANRRGPAPAPSPAPAPASLGLERPPPLRLPHLSPHQQGSFLARRRVPAHPLPPSAGTGATGAGA